ncbi:MAG TPA: hypothetical protein VK306_05670 [Acidimicrobiales bacterium]|nr:hypothetical protein [Acidimicrobiales bacterium]
MREDRPTLLASLVARDERTQEEIVAGFEVCARDNGEDASLSLRTLRRWMLGDVRTTPRPAQRRVARAYWGHSMDELLAPAPPGTPTTASPITATPSRRPATILDATSTPAAVPAIAAEPTAVPDLVPATHLAVDGSPGSAAAIVPPPPVLHADLPSPLGDRVSSLERQVAMSSRRALRFTSYAESRNAGPEAVEQLGAEIGELAADYIRVPISTIMTDLVAAQDSVFTLLEGRQRAADTLELYMLASVASGLLAKASHDLGKWRDAMTQARTMYVCADNADHLGLRVWSRGLQSLIAYWAGRPQEAVRYARAGTMIMGDDVRGTVAAWLPALEARALAQQGNAMEARAAVRRALAAREALLPDELDRIGGLLTFPVAKQHYYAAGAYVALDGGHDEAADHAASALDLYEQVHESERSFSDIAGARAELALARVRSGELEGARDALAPVLELDPDRRIGGIVTSAERVENALRNSPELDSALADELRDEIETFRRAPASALGS